MEKKSPHLPKLSSIFSKAGIVALLAVFFVVGFGVGYDRAQKQNPLNLSQYWQVYNLLKSKYIGNVDTTKAEQGTIEGLVSSLGDPYSVYMPPEDKSNFEQDLKGQFEGIGAELTQKDGSVVVMSPLTGAPAEKAGLKANDIIVKVDDTSAEGLTLNDVVGKIRGPKGSTVKITVIRAGNNDPVVISIVRDTITVKSVEWKMINNIGYIEVRQFGDDTVDLFKQGVTELAAKSPKAIIIDMRNNPGGYLNAVAPMVGQFIAPNVVVYEKEKNGDLTDIRSTDVPVLPNMPLYILTNNGSASAAEIFSGAMQDYKRATLIGQKTFGKGSVQDLINLSDGSALKVTIAEWLTPNKRTINKTGIDPDVKVDGEKTATSDPVLDKALELAKANK